MNVLITSLSRKVPLIGAVRRALAAVAPTGKVTGADGNAACLGRHFVDDFWQMPPLESLSLPELIAYCNAQGIRWLIPTRDGELAYFAHHRDALRQAEIAVMVSSPEAIERCLDKLQFSQTLLHKGFPAIATADTLDALPDTATQFVVKSRSGAGARGVGVALDKQAARTWANELQSPIFQPYITGPEYTADIYLTQAGKAHGAVIRLRELVVNGESQVTVTLRDDALEALCIGVAEALGLSGHVNLQFIRDAENQVHFLECNPRFGGASSLSVAAGLDSFYWFFLESLGQDLDAFPFRRVAGELRQVRYPEDRILPA